MRLNSSLSRSLALAVGILVLPALLPAAGNAPQPSICTRACWSARAPKSYTYMSALTRAVIHHTAGASDYNTSSLSQSASKVRAIQNMHMDSMGWSDIGYNFLTDKLGNIFEGRFNSRTHNTRGSHDSVNTNSFGFNVMGYFHSPYNQTPTPAMRSALYDVIAWRMPNPFDGFGSGTYNGKTVGYLCGHRNVMATACPGDLMHAYIGNNNWSGEARTEVNNRIVGVPSGPEGIVVDNLDPGYSETGSWSTSSNAGYFYQDSRWAGVFDQPQNNTATWTPGLADAGTYKVYAWWVAGSNRSPGAAYYVHHTGGSTLVRANQQVNGGKWNLLGEFAFMNGAGSKVVLESDTSFNGGNPNAVISADAVLFEFIAPMDYIVDNTDAGFAASSNWFTSASSPGYYGSNYHARATEAASDPAQWACTLPYDGHYKVDTRWTEHSNRASSAPYVVTTANGDVTVTVNQRVNGGKWMNLGQWYLWQGNAVRVKLSCWTSSGSYVIADAVRWTHAD